MLKLKLQGDKTKMIVKSDLIKRVRDYFDLNIYETKVWLALLAKGVASAGEIAQISGVPRSRTYDVLESLEKMGFVIERLGKPVKYIAVKPDVVIEKLKNNTMKYAEEKIETLSKLKGTQEYIELEGLHNIGVEPIKNRDISSSIKGRSNLYAQIIETMESAEKSVYMAISKEELLAKEKMFSNIFAKLNKRKVMIKVMINDSDEETKKLSKKFNVSIKSKNFNARFILVDKEELLFTVNSASTHEDFDNGLWINSEYFSNSLAYMFELAWVN